jgi:hypothetical protein
MGAFLYFAPREDLVFMRIPLFQKRNTGLRLFIGSAASSMVIGEQLAGA